MCNNTTIEEWFLYVYQRIGGADDHRLIKTPVDTPTLPKSGLHVYKNCVKNVQFKDEMFLRHTW